ncbi:MAG: TonB-dependent receptor, partial [Bacteroidota bacterium]
PFSLEAEDQLLSEALKLLLRPTTLGYLFFSDHAVIIGRQAQLDRLDAFSMDAYLADQESKPKLQAVDKVYLGDSTLRPRPAEVTLTGLLYDLETEEPLGGGQVAFPELRKGAFADDKGRFEITLPSGVHQIELTATGHEQRKLQIEIFSDADWSVPLVYTAYYLDEVLVEAQDGGQDVGSTQLGKEQLSVRQLRQNPPLLGEVDVVNAILLLPGVSSVGEGASGFNVRGGNVDQNLIMQDGAMFFNSSHLLGIFSIFNADLVDRVDLYKGHIPARFGGRVSSVLDVKLIDGSFQQLKGRASVGIFSSRLALNGPLKKGRNSLVFGVRTAYPNLITQYVQRVPTVASSSAWYGDATLKFTQKLGENGKLAVSGTGSQDAFSFSETFGFVWSNYALGADWQQILSEKFSLEASVNAGRYLSQFTNSEGVRGSEQTTGLDNYRFKLGGQFTPGRKHNFHFGVDGVYYNVLPNAVSPAGEDAAISPFTAQKDQGLEMGIYVSDEFDLNPFLRIYAGLRYSRFQNLGPYTVYQYPENEPRRFESITDSTVFGAGEGIANYQGLEPRVSLRIALSESASIKLSYNRIFQYLHLLSNTASATPIDLWQVSNSYFPAQRSDNYSLGFFKNFKGKTWQTSLEFFYRDMTGLVVARDFARLLGNPHIETEVLNADGLGFGGEARIKRSYGKWQSEVSFTYSRALRQTVNNAPGEFVNGGQWFPSDFDSPINITASITFKPVPTQTISAQFNYRTGRPITVPTGVLSLYPSWFVPIFSERNITRLPDYHRLDLSYTFDDGLLRRDGLKTDITFSVYNLYARENAFSVFYERRESSFQANQLAVLGTFIPFVSYNLKF